MQIIIVILCSLIIASFAQAKTLDDALIAKNNTNSLNHLASIEGGYNKIALLSSSSSYASFFELDEKVISVSVVGSSEAPTNLKGKLSFFKAKIDKTEVDSLKRYLNTLGIKSEGIDEIVRQLVNGTNGSRQCKGNKSDCIIYSPDFITVVDFYNNGLRMFIPDKWFETDDKQIVLEVGSESLLVSGWYGSVSYTDEMSYFLRSDNVYGLGNGYVRYDFNASENATDVGQFNYNYDAPDYSFTGGIIANTQRLGISGQHSLINDKFVGVELSNQKLLEVRNFAARNVEFFSPSDGVLTVYNSNKDLIYQSNIQSGRNSIPYSFLPYGNYAVTYEVTKNNNVVFKSENFVSNSDAFDASDFSTYVRLGKKEQNTSEEKKNLLFDAGLSIPIFQQHSLIGSATLVEEEWFSGLGYYANINDYRLSTKYTLSDNADQLEADLYSQLLNLSISKTDVQSGKHSYLGSQDSLLITAGINKSFGLSSIGFSTSYNDTSEDAYISYSINGSQSFKNGVSLYASYSGGDFQDVLSVGVSVSLSPQSNYSATYTDNQGNLELNNQVTSNYRVNDQLTLNGGATHHYEQDQRNGIDVYINGNHRNDSLTSSVGVRRQKDGKLTYNGSFSTTAYLTGNNLYFKDTRSSNNSAIEILGLDDDLQGRVKLYDKVSGRKNIEEVSGDTLFDMSPYSQVIIDYEFDSDDLALTNIDLERNTSLNLLPGKIHYINVKQQPIANILVVSNGANTEGIICTGQACVDNQNVNSKVLKFRVKPGQNFAIHRNGEMCFSGEVEQGETNVGVCHN
ncbi:FimD/usher-like TcfC protein [Vibrio crassostreae]|uniref:TcfC E-set like domain-containing protein n=1 Tax=Vibrio crassostreae TaxID=246167 RepID=UPI00119C0835|nr:TcfC E-set like domain-containing protein [Vibrio crassostreae]TWD40950.1 FimD/usher-like TcfC protein [Vibrio crassostreae]